MQLVFDRIANLTDTLIEFSAVRRRGLLLLLLRLLLSHVKLSPVLPRAKD